MTRIDIEAFAESCRRLRRKLERYKDCIVSTELSFYTKRQINKMLSENIPRREIESLFNHEHMSMVLSIYDCSDFDWKDAAVIAEVHAAMLERQLRQQYPDRNFVVQIISHLDDDENADIDVVFYQE